jgi:hypothetical protein
MMKLIDRDLHLRRETARTDVGRLGTDVEQRGLAASNAARSPPTMIEAFLASQ